MTRPRGFAAWRPQEKTRALTEAVKAILASYRDQLPLTLRQVFYIAVTREIVGKTENDYTRLCEYLVRARRAQLMPMDALRDDGFTMGQARGWVDTQHFTYNVQRWVDDFTLDRQEGQDTRLIVWCEAQGMVPQLQRVADDYSVPVYSSGGFDSLTTKHAVAQQISGEGEAVEVLHIGDHDPSGVHIFGSLDEDIRAFVDDLGGCMTGYRLAVTPAQVQQFNLPTAPPKPTDRRRFEGNVTTQCEALDPATLATIVRSAIESRQDASIRQSVIDRELDSREELRKRFSLAS